MSRTLQFKRLANTHLAQVIGANGEIIVDYTNDTLTVHDGQTLGGSRLATETHVTNSIKANSTFLVANNFFLRVSPTTGFLQIRSGLIYSNSSSYIGRAQLDTLAENVFNMVIQTNSFTNHTGIKLEERGSIITYANDVYISTNVTSVGLNSNNSWRFSNTGTLTFPDSTVQSTAYNANTISTSTIDTYARITSNTATNNIIILQGVNTTQNTNIATVTGLAQASFNLANTISAGSVDTLARTTANTATNNIIIIQGVDTTQNTNISSANNIATAAFAKANTNISSDLTLTVTNSGSGAYLIDGASNPTVTLYRGVTYYFSISASGHPFFIQTVSGAYSSGNLYTSGVTGAGTQVGTLTFTVPLNAPSNLYYVCQYHSAMNGAFLIENLISTVNVSISTTELKALVANAATYAAFQSAIAAL